MYNVHFNATVTHGFVNFFLYLLFDCILLHAEGEKPDNLEKTAPSKARTTTHLTHMWHHDRIELGPNTCTAGGEALSLLLYPCYPQQYCLNILHASLVIYKHTCCLNAWISSNDLLLLTAKTQRKPSPVLIY